MCRSNLAAPQYATTLGKNANCQTLVSLTLARGEVPVAVGLRLFLPEAWTADPDRMARAGVPDDLRRPRTKAEIALGEIDRVRVDGARFGSVLADAGYGSSAPARADDDDGLCLPPGATPRSRRPEKKDRLPAAPSHDAGGPAGDSRSPQRASAPALPAL